MILHFFPKHPMVFFISSWEDLRGFDFINYIYIQHRHKRCKKLHVTVWQKLITVAKGKAKIEMSPFS